MIPWLIVEVVVGAMLVVAFVVARRNTAAGERLPAADTDARERPEREFADAEAYEAEWHEVDKERFHNERLP